MRLDSKMPSSGPPTAAEPPNPHTPAAAQPLKDKKAGAGKQGKEPAIPTDSSKLSFAELKAIAKAEKAARRAQAILDKQSTGAVPTQVGDTGSTKKSDPQKGPKGVQKKAGSTAVEARNLPVRGAQKSASVVETPKEEDKTVEFFRHLYKPRMTSIAGAGRRFMRLCWPLGCR